MISVILMASGCSISKNLLSWYLTDVHPLLSVAMISYNPATALFTIAPEAYEGLVILSSNSYCHNTWNGPEP